MVTRFGKTSHVIKNYTENHMPNNEVKEINNISKGHTQALYTNGVKIHFKHSTEPFQKFPQVYQDLDYNSRGSSINKNKLEKAISNDCTFIVIGYRNGAMYRYPAQKYKEFTEKHGTIRQTQYQNQTEKTCSIPLEKMEKLQ